MLSLVVAGNRGVEFVYPRQLRGQGLHDLVRQIQLRCKGFFLGRDQLFFLGDVGVQHGFDVAVGLCGER